MEETKNELIIKDFNELESKRRSKTDVFTTLTDAKTIFNLDNSTDYKLNDCKGEVIKVVDVLIKFIETPLDEPVLDDNGDVIQDKEYKKITILIDDKGKSYVTASKMFTNQLMRYIRLFGVESVKEGLTIKIVERAVKNSSNKALGFELA